MGKIKLDLDGNVEELFSKMKQAVSDVDGELQGDENTGSFVIPVAIGKIEGTYILTEEGMEIDVTKKPFLVSNKMIKEKLEEFLSKE